MNAVFLVLLSIILAAPALAEELPVVLFDHGHNQRFLIDKEGPLQLSGLAAIFKDQGLKSAAHEGPITADSLAGAQALVISGAFDSFKPAEIDAIAAFLEKGGNLAVMLHIGPPLVGLLEKLGVVVSGSVIHEQENIIKETDTNFKVTQLDRGFITAGIEWFSVYGGWALLNEGPATEVRASSSDKAWIDLNGDKKLSKDDAMQSFAVIVSGNLGKGRFVIFADDAIFQNQYLDENNSKLAVNLAQWMK